MGVFKDIMAKVFGNSMSDEIENVLHDIEEKYENKQVEKTELKVVSLDFKEIPASREFSAEIFDADDEREYEVKLSYQVAPGFWAFESGAGEVDAAYAYVPEIRDEEAFTGWEYDMPYLAVVFDNMAYEVLEEYRTEGTIRSGAALEKVEHETIKFKSTYTRDHDKYVNYHFYRLDEEIDYHIQAYIPKACLGTQVEKEVLAALDFMAATYREERTPTE